MTAGASDRRRQWRTAGSYLPRRGVAMVLVVACLATFSLIALAMLRGSLVSRGQLRSEQHLRQAALLLDAAAIRAHAQAVAGGLSTVEEQYDIPAEEITGTSAAQITVTGGEADGLLQLTVVCRYPVEGPRAVRRSRRLAFPLPTTDASDQNTIPSPEETVP